MDNFREGRRWQSNSAHNCCADKRVRVGPLRPVALYEAWNFHFAAVALLNWLPIVYHGVATVIAYILWYQGIAKVTASTAGIFSGIIPVSAVVLSVLLLREPMFWSYWVGIGCVCGAIVLISGRWHSTQRSSHS